MRKPKMFVCAGCRKKVSALFPGRRKFCLECQHQRTLRAARAYRAALKKQGRCLICRKPAKAKGASRCAKCLRANALGTQRWYRKQKQAKKSRR